MIVNTTRNAVYIEAIISTSDLVFVQWDQNITNRERERSLDDESLYQFHFMSNENSTIVVGISKPGFGLSHQSTEEYSKDFLNADSHPLTQEDLDLIDHPYESSCRNFHFRKQRRAAIWQRYDSGSPCSGTLNTNIVIKRCNDAAKIKKCIIIAVVYQCEQQFCSLQNGGKITKCVFIAVQKL